MNGALRLGLFGAGLIGRRHAALIGAETGVELCGIADPSETAQGFAADIGVPWYADPAELITAERPDGVIIATPNALHADHGRLAVEAGIPALIEKPITDRAETAEALVEAAENAGVPLLIGHHRRHNPLIQAAKETIEAGRLGRITAVHAQFWLYKPDGYYDMAWRREPGGGPIFINLIHDIDLLRCLCGEIVSVTCQISNAVRGFAVEDTAAALVRFENGALGTVTASDCTVAPWSWEQTAGENPAYPRTDEHSYTIGGTHGSLALPKGDFWSASGERSWWEPLNMTRTVAPEADPLVRQLQHFRAVVRGDADPLVPGAEGLRTLRVIEALAASGRSGREEHV